MKTVVQGRVRLMVHDNGQAVIVFTPDERVSEQLREMMLGLPSWLESADMWVAGGRTYPVAVAKIEIPEAKDESTTAKFARALRLLAEALESGGEGPL